MTSANARPSLEPPRRVGSTLLGDHGVLRVHAHELDSGARGVTLDVPDWCCAAAVTPEGELVLVRQYRHGVDGLTLEVAGGIIDPGEEPEPSALRELFEEAGFEGARVEPLGVVHPNPALQGNRCFLYLVHDAMQVAAPLCQGSELTEVVVLSQEEVRRALADGRITHALTVLTLERALERLDVARAHELAPLLERMREAQADKVLALARRLAPHLTAEDIKNPHDFKDLNDHDWHFEDGQLTALEGVLFALRQHTRR
jgi:ADP-ribose pyrophosphatase